MCLGMTQECVGNDINVNNKKEIEYDKIVSNYLQDNSKTVYLFTKNELEIIKQALNDSSGFYHSGDDEYKQREKLYKKVNSMLEGKWNCFFYESST